MPVVTMVTFTVVTNQAAGDVDIFQTQGAGSGPPSSGRAAGEPGSGSRGEGGRLHRRAEVRKVLCLIALTSSGSVTCMIVDTHKHVGTDVAHSGPPMCGGAVGKQRGVLGWL